jgi:hypothetical protein
MRTWQFEVQRLEVTFKRTTGPLSFLANYTYSKSYDQTSNIQEQVDPYNYHALYHLGVRYEARLRR